MRVVLAMMIPLLAACAEPNPAFSTSMWFDGMEEVRPTEQLLHAGPNSTNPGEWARTTEMANNGSNAWRFGDGTSYPVLSNASLLTPDFEAGSQSFLRFSYWSDIQPLSEASGSASSPTAATPTPSIRSCWARR